MSGMAAKRVEITLPEPMWQEIERRRGDTPRATWIKLAIEAHLKANVDAYDLALADLAAALQDPEPVFLGKDRT